MAREEKPIVPPTRKPVAEYQTPSPAVVFFTELVNRTSDAYTQNAPVARGTLYSSIVGANQQVISAYPDLYFLKERKLAQNDQLVFWDWATVPDAEDTYNAEVDYVSNAVPYPAFTRVYTIKRDTYDSSPTLAIGSNLTGLIGVNIVNGGQDYTFANGTINGTDVAIEFVIQDGVIVSGVITNEGTGILSTSTIIVTGDGSGATVTPIVQGTTCYLTKQKKQELAQDDPLRNEFVRVIRVYETLPGPFIASTRIDEDGKVVTINTRRNIAASIASAETLIGGQWCKTTKKGDDNFVGEEVVECRDIPGNPVPSSRLDTDAVAVSIVTTLKDTTAITTQETLVGGTWTRITKKEVSDLVAQEIVESRAIPGQAIVETVIDKNGDITTITRTLVQASTIATTSTVIANLWTKTYEVPLNGSKLIATKTVEVRTTQNSLDSYEVEIPDLIPVEFRPDLPITTHEDTVIGTASLPTLAPGDLMRRQAQIDQYTYRLTIRGRSGITLPKTITNKETTSQFGGGDINVTMTLDLFNNLSLDEGLTVLVPSEIRKLDDQVNGLAVKTSKILNAASWPVLDGTHVDERYGIAIDIQRQTVDAGTTGGLIGGAFVEVRPHDKWKSIQITSTLNPDSLPEDVQWFGGQVHSFPPELSDAIIEWAEATCGCVDAFTSVLQSNFNRYEGMVKARYTEQFYNGVPPDDVVIDQFFPQSHTFGFAFASVCGCGSDSTSRVRAIAPQYKIPLCLHDDLTLCVGGGVACAGAPFSWTFPATSPAVLPHGSYIMLPPHVERWRFGVFRRVLTEVLVP